MDKIFTISRRSSHKEDLLVYQGECLARTKLVIRIVRVVPVDIELAVTIPVHVRHPTVGITRTRAVAHAPIRSHRYSFSKIPGLPKHLLGVSYKAIASYVR